MGKKKSSHLFHKKKKGRLQKLWVRPGHDPLWVDAEVRREEPGKVGNVPQRLAQVGRAVRVRCQANWLEGWLPLTRSGITCKKKLGDAFAKQPQPNE